MRLIAAREKTWSRRKAGWSVEWNNYSILMYSVCVVVVVEGWFNTCSCRKSKSLQL